MRQARRSEGAKLVPGRCLEAAVGPGTAGRSRHRRGFSFSGRETGQQEERASTAHAWEQTAQESSEGLQVRGASMMSAAQSWMARSWGERSRGLMGPPSSAMVSHSR